MQPLPGRRCRKRKKELQQAVAASDRDATEEELGDLFFALAVYTRKLDLEPETTLNRANNKFQKRFEAMEAQVKSEGKDWKELSLEDLENRWNQAKKSRNALDNPLKPCSHAGFQDFPKKGVQFSSVCANMTIVRRHNVGAIPI